MRGFVIGWLLAFAFVGLVAVGIGVAVGPRTPPPTPTPVRRIASDAPQATAEPFTQEAAVEVVSRRFATNSRGAEYRRELRQAARVSYHSPEHWTVRWGAASWTAHGPGRYAEPDNDAARQREAETAAGS